MPLTDHDKFTLNLARELLSRVGCVATNPYDPKALALCCCTGQCQSPLANELRALIESLDRQHHEPAKPDGYTVGGMQWGFTWPVGWPVGYRGPRG